MTRCSINSWERDRLAQHLLHPFNPNSAKIRLPFCTERQQCSNEPPIIYWNELSGTKKQANSVSSEMWKVEFVLLNTALNAKGVFQTMKRMGSEWYYFRGSNSDPKSRIWICIIILSSLEIVSIGCKGGVGRFS